MGFSQLPRQLDIMNASEFAQYRNDYAYFGSDANHPDVGKDTPLSGSVYSDPLSLGEGTNWINEITRRITLRSPTTTPKVSSRTAASSVSRDVSTSNASCSNG